MSLIQCLLLASLTSCSPAAAFRTSVVSMNDGDLQDLLGDASINGSSMFADNAEGLQTTASDIPDYVRCFDQDRSFLVVGQPGDSHSVADESFIRGFPPDADSITILKELDGASGPKQVEYASPDGTSKFIMKANAPYQRMASEFSAIKLFGTYAKVLQTYSAVPSCCLYPRDSGEGTLMCKWLSGLQKVALEPRTMKQYFILSLIAGHYDIGTPGNTMYHHKSQDLYFIDLGDCFGYSASGSPKSAHYCDHRSHRTCKEHRSEDRKCFIATWGGIPYQILDFRNGIGYGGWEDMERAFGEIGGSSMARLFDKDELAVLHSINACCQHETETELREVLHKRLLNLGIYFRSSMTRLDEKLRPRRIHSQDLKRYNLECDHWDKLLPKMIPA